MMNADVYCTEFKEEIMFPSKVVLKAATSFEFVVAYIISFSV